MSIGKYVTSLLPSFEKARVEEDLRMLKDDLHENTLPPYEAAAGHFKRDAFKAGECKDFDKAFNQQVRVERAMQGRYPATIHAVLVRTEETVQMLDDQVDKLFGRDIAASGLSYTRANVLRLIEVIGFTTKYARKLLLWTYANEKAALKHSVGTPLTKAEIEWLVQNRQSFFMAITLLSKKSKEIEGALKLIPDMVVVPAEVEVAEQTVGAKRLDPLQMGIIPIKLNPIYHVRMAIAEYQVNRHKAGVEERRALEYRLLALKELQDGKKDAALEQQIEYTENRLKKLNHKLAKMEEED